MALFSDSRLLLENRPEMSLGVTEITICTVAKNFFRYYSFLGILNLF